MSWTRRIPGAAFLLVAVGLMACEEESVAPGDPQTAEQRARARQHTHEADKTWHHMYGTWLDLAKEIPGYAGHWGEDGATVIGLTNPGIQAVKAREVFSAQHHQLSYDASARSVTQTAKVRYDVYDILHWHNEASALIGENDIWGVGLAFDENAITVHITPDADESRVEEGLKAIGIPLDGIVIKREERPTTLDAAPTNLARQDTIYRLNSRAVGGGLRPGFQVEVARSARRDGACTLGVVLDTREKGIMLGTNAHCTDYMDHVDENKLHQPLVPASDSEIATEVWHSPRRTEDDDGPPTVVECDFSGGCMFADFALFEITNMSRHGRVGDIQRTRTGNPRDITTRSDLYTTMDRAWFNRFVMGDIVEMIGQTSGEVDGRVENPCISFDVIRDDPPESIRFLCQTRADASADGGIADGDSGAPVIGSTNTSAPVFLGMVHAGSSRWMYFSPTMDLVPFRQYRPEIGAMKFCATCAWIDPE